MADFDIRGVGCKILRIIYKTLYQVQRLHNVALYERMISLSEIEKGLEETVVAYYKLLS